MEMFPHFSHDHPLIFREDEDEAKYEKPRFCNACGMPMLSSPSYSCSINGCDDFCLHESCMSLPLKLKHKKIVYDIYEHDLNLHAKPPSENSWECSKCGKMCKNFTYHCSQCEFNLHPYCAYPLEIKSKHRSHHHPLVAVCREVESFCDACGTKHQGQFFSCQQCNLWIHQDCLLLPTLMWTHHQHPLTLSYSVDQFIKNKGRFPFRLHCQMCKQQLATSLWHYFCRQCHYCVHLRCALSTMENWDKTRPVVQFPDEVDTFLNLVMGTVSASKDQINNIHKGGGILKEEHFPDHPLIFNHQQSSSSSSSIGVGVVCNACIKPIITCLPFYSCLRESCDFFLHEFCCHLSSKISYKVIRTSLSISPKEYLYNFFSVFLCSCCNLLCNGFAYITRTYMIEQYRSKENCIFLVQARIYVQCALAPSIIKHQSHHQHVLFLVNGKSDETIEYSCCSSNLKALTVYRCSGCDYKIHVRCAYLPKTVEHDLDEHHLQLMFGAPEENYYLCEICEGDISPKLWFYSCVECDQSFHVDCIPSVGTLSKIKFGGILNSTVHPHHPLTLIRMVTVYSKMCSFCQKVINGFVDDMAFQCCECDYMIHFECAKKCEAEGK